MNDFNPESLKLLSSQSKSSHKGQNGKVMLIAGSKLFHAASIWPLTVMSRMCDMVFYASVEENNSIVSSMKEKFLNGIVIPRFKIDDYIEETDAILIGPGLPREDGLFEGDDNTKTLTESLLKKYPHKKWVIDGGSLQVINPELLPKGCIITPHSREFQTLFKEDATEESVVRNAQKYNITVLSKGEVDFIASPHQSVRVKGGNSGMTKGGTGDVLAGLVVSLFCKNDAFLSASAASFINKKAGDELFKRVGHYFNASDLADEIPRVMSSI